MSLVKTKRHIINIFFVFMALFKSLGIDLRYNNTSQHIKLNSSSLNNLKFSRFLNNHGLSFNKQSNRFLLKFVFNFSP